MMKSLSILGLISILLVLPGMTMVAPEPVADTCPTIVRTALDFTNDVCAETGRNEACYGHVLVDAEPKTDVEGFVFDEAGDMARLVDMRSLRLSPMDVQEEHWGVALMHLQANLPDTASHQNVTLLAFGDVQIENASEEAALLETIATTTERVLVRAMPSSWGYVIGTLEPEQTVTATGRLEDSSWLRVILPDTGATGWVHGSLLAPANEGDFMALNLVEADSAYYRPLQAFYFQSGVDDAACAQAPESGMLIQTPEGVGEVRLLVNEVSIALGSTAFVQAGPGKGLIVHLLEGSGWVKAQGVKQPLFPGTEVTVPLGEDLSPAGPPTAPRPYDMESLRSLPLGSLEHDIEVHPSMSREELNARMEAFLALMGEEGGNDTQSSGDASATGSEGVGSDPASGGDGGDGGDSSPSGNDEDWNPPGLQDNPALGDEGPPGLQDKGGVPPGQGKK